ncbi:MAG TPA: saccharopine dehydrogenase C-terminal domain-containing protein [Ferruginibacter sp.]|nr:saccharopine dehydrogenase C-terminal domain-containing protein [Ferruginibacter sp.]HRE62975.1 saccharopine dehydrogenase C-terminal domain-containing protein [Ferruginibacter sp.]
MKTILLFGAGKSASVLIKYLLKEAEINHWKFIVADANKEVIEAKTDGSKFAEAVQLDINNDIARELLIQRAHVIISMMPPALHFLIAKDCVEYRKHLLTASYLDDKMKSLRDEINHRKLLFLCEMGLDPGIDHMSAMKIIDDIKQKGGSISSFKSHCGGLIAPESDDNPWHYKISWNPRNVVLAGNAGAVYLQDGQLKNVHYQNLFDEANAVKVDELEQLAYYPNRDSLAYIPVYKLQDAQTFMRTTLRYPSFFAGWNVIVEAALTDDKTPINTTGLTYKKWSQTVLPFVNENNKNLLEFLGLFNDEEVPASAKTSADILQYLLETKLAMQPTDKDMIVMLHEFEFNLNGQKNKLQSSLLVKGQDSVHTAMAKTVGLPLGIAAKLILNGTLNITGLHIPILKEIYEPVLQELENEHIIFKEKCT